MKRFNVCGLGNAIVDILVDVSNEEFASFGLERSSMKLVQSADQEALLTALSHKTPRLVSGGSVGNSCIAVAQLGGKSAYLTSLGDDRYGLFYRDEAKQLGVEIGSASKFRKDTGTCVALITPDAERTMCTCLGAAALLSPDDINEELIRHSQWLFIEGYLFANPEASQQAIFSALDCAARFDTKVAITVSEDFIATVFGATLEKALLRADLIFCNEREACALSSESSADEAFQSLSKRFPGLVVTKGAEGALIQYAGDSFSVPAFPCDPVDLLGAGDMFAAGILYGLSSGTPLPEAARAACYIAMKVITRHGARVHTGLKEFWHEGSKSSSEAVSVAQL